MAALVTNVAPAKWAQRKDIIYLTIELPDVKDESLTLTNDKLVFAGKSNGKDYVLNLEFLHPLDADASSWKVLQRSVQLVLAKADPDAEFWVRLLKDKVLEKTNVKIDWDKYVDEDEAEGKDIDMSNMEGASNFGGGGGMDGGMGGMGGMGGPGGPGGGMDPAMMAQMMGGMGGGAGGPGGGMDLQAMMAQMGGGMGGMGGGMGDMGGGDFGGDGGDSDDEAGDALPDLDDDEPDDKSENVD